MAIAVLSLLLLSAAAPQPGSGSAQARYDAAQAAFDRGDWAGAAQGFAGIVRRDGGSRSDGMIRARYAEALLHLGRLDEAAREARRAVAEFPSGGVDEERGAAYADLGNVLRAGLEMSGAVAAYERALTELPSGASSGAKLGLAQAEMTTNPARAARLIDDVLADPALVGELNKTNHAMWLALRARAFLNGGDLPGARAMIGKAMTLAGPLTPSVSIAQALVRADAALIYTMAKQPEQARLYLAYTGAPYMPKGTSLPLGNLELPVCGGEIRPEDVAVIQFGIDPGGQTVDVQPIYVNRAGPAGILFAQAARQWQWDPDFVKKVPLFFRAAVRIEMRCVTRPEPESLSEPFRVATLRWLDANGGPEALDRKLHSAGLDGAARFGPSAATLDLPPDVLAYSGYEAIRKRHAKSDRLERLGGAEDYRAWATLLDGVSGADHAAAWLRIEAAIAFESNGRFDAAQPLLEAVLRRTPNDGDEIRTVALLHRSIVDAKLGHAEVAQARLAEAGLSPDRCAMFDVRPLVMAANVTSHDYPGGAIMWGFEGQAREAYDITAGGTVTGVRTVLAYPPFVFGDNAAAAAARFRFLPPTLNGKPLGCMSRVEGFSFRTAH